VETHFLLRKLGVGLLYLLLLYDIIILIPRPPVFFIFFTKNQWEFKTENFCMLVNDRPLHKKNQLWRKSRMRNSYATNCGLHFRFNFNFVWTMVECNTYLQFQDSLSPNHEMRCTVTCATKSVSSNNFQIMVHSIYFLACGKHHAHIFQPRIYFSPDVCDVTLSVHPHRASWKVNCLATVGIEPATCGILVQWIDHGGTFGILVQLTIIGLVYPNGRGYGLVSQSSRVRFPPWLSN
jgi:hypothetical protein